MDNTINFTPTKLATLKVAYDKAVADKQEQFKFEGHDLLTAYAKYLIEYLDMELKPIPVRLDRNRKDNGL